MTTPTDAPLPQTIGGYAITGLLGEGGMGRVFRARDETLGREVAIKVMLPELARDQEMSARFLREARAMARISSPHVVTVFQVGDERGAPFLVMELLVGEDLAARLKREGRLSVDVATRYIKDTARGLDAACQAGLIHRDVKPANLFVAADHVKLTDFGLARPLDGSADLTAAGLVVGTPHYLAPELAKGAQPSVQSDLYALGATYFELVAGRPPYPGKQAVEVLTQHITSSIPDLHAVAPDVPLALVAVITRLLAKAPRDRYATYDELVRAIDDALAPKPTSSTQLFGAMPKTSPTADTALAPALVDANARAAPDRTAVVTPGTMDIGEGAGAPALVDDARERDVVAASGVAARVSGVAPTVKTAPLTVMFTDIAGYTERTAQQSREEAARWLAIHDALLQPVIKAFGGKLVKTIGDAFLATFASPTDAVLCGMAIQDRLFTHNQGVPTTEQIHVRVALSAGEVRLHRGDIFGDAVNLASRLEGLATPGEVLFSDAVYATMNTAEVVLEPRGEHRFKGIQRAVQVYACKKTGAPGAPPFGGHLLARVQEGNALARVADAAGKAAQAADVARVKVETGLKAVISQVMRRIVELRQPDVDVAASLRRAWPVAAGLFGIALVVIVVTLVSDRRLARIDDGEAEAVLAELEAIPDEKRAPDDELMRGHALFALDKSKSAMKAYGRAVEQGKVDARAAENVLSLLDRRDAASARDLLVSWPDDDIESELRALLDDEWFPRHHALAILEKRDAIDDDGVTDVAILDLQTAACDERKYGVALLKRRGTGKRAISALEEAKDRPLSMPALLCIGLEYQSAIAAIEERDKKR